MEPERLDRSAQLLARRFGPVGSVAYVPFGPLIAQQCPDEAVTALVQELLRQTRRGRIRALFVQPPEGGERVRAALRLYGFRPAVVDVAPSATVRLDLRVGPEKLLEGMSKHARRDFHQSQRDPLTVRRGTRGDLRSFHDLYCCTAARQHFEPLPLRYLETLWDELHPSGSVEVFLARVDGSDVAGNMVTLFSGTVTGRLLGFDPLRLSRRLRPNEALIWAIINWAVEHGATTLDVGGVARAAAEEGTTASSAQQMKMRLGGDVILYPGALELIPNLALRSGFGLLRSSQLVRRVGDRLRASSAATARR